MYPHYIFNSQRIQSFTMVIRKINVTTRKIL